VSDYYDRTLRTHGIGKLYHMFFKSSLSGTSHDLHNFHKTLRKTKEGPPPIYSTERQSVTIVTTQRLRVKQTLGGYIRILVLDAV
jgi:hypothetical protein